MTMQNAFRDILSKADGLSLTLQDIVRWAVVEGAPEAGDHVLVSRYDEATNDLLGLLQELRSNAHRGAHRPGQDYASARRVLIECQQRAALIAHRFYWELYSPEAVEALQLLRREGSPEWQSWITGVEDALARCRAPIEELSASVVQAWMELSDLPAPVTRQEIHCSSVQGVNPVPIGRSQTDSK